MQKSAWMVPLLIGSHHTCRAVHSKSLQDMLFQQKRPLFVAFPRDRCSVPLLFSLYTRQLADLIDKLCIDYHFFADDSELYSCLPTEPESALSELRKC